jgi:hypothetical protein
MSRASQWGRWLALTGAVFAVFEFFLQDLLYGLPIFVSDLVGLWWAFLGVGVAALAFDRGSISVPAIRTEPSVQRQDIIRPTNWARTGKYDLRKSYGIGLVVAALVAFILALIVGNVAIGLLWLVAGLVGAVWMITAWRFGRDITADRTATFSVRAPDLFSAHDFHIAIRQAVEDLGYKIQRETSPGIGGEPAEHNGEIFHAKGGFKGRKRPIASSRLLVSDVADEPYVSELLTLSTAGVVATLIGITSLASASIPLETAMSTSEFDIVYLVGPVFLFGGVAATLYDYYTRTREWGELYCVEEGTVHGSTTRMYEDRTLESLDSHAEPTVTTAESSATLSVTVGAKSSGLFDDDELESDLDTLVEAVDRAAAANKLDVVSRDADNGVDVNDHVGAVRSASGADAAGDGQNGSAGNREDGTGGDGTAVAAVTCPDCGADVNESTGFCESCGASIGDD